MEGRKSGKQTSAALPLVSIIIPCHNAMPWLDECLASCASQDYEGPLEVSIFDDSSTDGSDACIRAWAEKLQDVGIKCTCSGNRWPDCAGSDATAPAGGAGRARNKAVFQSSGAFLCFMDADDVMLSHRVRRQLEAALESPRAIVGAGFVKLPEGATEHYAKWANYMCDTQLWLQHFREITVLMPTWFFSREVFDRVGSFVEADPKEEGEAEDLLFFHKYISLELQHLAATTPESVCGSSASVCGASASVCRSGGTPAATTPTHTTSPPTTAPPTTPSEAQPIAPCSSVSTACLPRGDTTGGGCHALDGATHPHMPPHSMPLIPRLLVRVGNAQDALLRYRYTPTSGSWRTPRSKLLRIKAAAFEAQVLNSEYVVNLRWWGGGPPLLTYADIC
jgi:hypothetical protein